MVYPWIQIYIIYRRTGFKCVVKCLRLRENELIAFPIIAIAAHPVHVVPVVIIFCVPMIANPGKIRNSQLLAARKHFPSYGIYIYQRIAPANSYMRLASLAIKYKKTFKNEQRNRDDTAKKRVNTSGVRESINYYEDIYNIYTSLSVRFAAILKRCFSYNRLIRKLECFSLTSAGAAIFS